MNTSHLPVHFNDVSGFDKRTNNVLYHSPTVSNGENSVVIYFGGDIQNFSEEMKNNAGGQKYKKWSLENTTLKLNSMFPTSHIIVVQPSKYENGIYSCFDNFVPSSSYGIPKHKSNYNAIIHMKSLLHNIADEINELQISNDLRNMKIAPQNQKSYDLHHLNKVDFTRSKFILIGFSKGCVVLNQLIYEFHYISLLPTKDKEVTDFISNITDMYFLDGGHNGKEDTWITGYDQLKTFSQLGVNIHIRVTPYQISDKSRPWIHKEEIKFYNVLKECGARLDRTVHFENEPASIDKHFEVLSVFKQT